MSDKLNQDAVDRLAEFSIQDAVNVAVGNTTPVGMRTPVVAGG